MCRQLNPSSDMTQSVSFLSLECSWTPEDVKQIERDLWATRGNDKNTQRFADVGGFLWPSNQSTLLSISACPPHSWQSVMTYFIFADKASPNNF